MSSICVVASASNLSNICDIALCNIAIRDDASRTGNDTSSTTAAVVAVDDVDVDDDDEDDTGGCIEKETVRLDVDDDTGAAAAAAAETTGGAVEVFRMLILLLFDVVIPCRGRVRPLELLLLLDVLAVVALPLPDIDVFRATLPGRPVFAATARGGGTIDTLPLPPLLLPVLALPTVTVVAPPVPVRLIGDSNY
jgi:hypothetical protein